MSFFYTREPGPEGKVISNEGEAPGRPLSDLLNLGPLPMRVALDLVSAIADILTIASEDGQSHGDIKPGFVRIDSAGAVSVEGYGQVRRTGRAPEGAPVGVASDTYGVGVILYAALTAEAMGAIPREQQAHDEAIVDRLLRIDWLRLQGRRWFDDILRFISSILAHNPAERPDPLDVANIFSEIAAQLDDEEPLVDWARRSIQDARAGRPRGARVEEDLGGPTSLSGFMANAPASQFRTAASAKGESTAFWTKDKIAALLTEADAPPEGNTRPHPGGDTRGPSRSSWTPPEKTPPPPPPPPEDRPARPRPSSPIQEESLAPPIANGGRLPDTDIRPPKPPPPLASPPSGDNPPKTGILRVVVVAVVLVAFMCAGGGLAGLALYIHQHPEIWTAATETPPPEGRVGTDEPEGVEGDEEGSGEGEEGLTTAGTGEEGAGTESPAGDNKPPEPETPQTSPGSTSGSSSGTTGGASSGTTGGSSSGTTGGSSGKGKGKGSDGGKAPSGGTGGSTPSTPSTPSSSGDVVGGSFGVKISCSGGETELNCGDGQRRSFVGSVRMTFESVTTCRVSVDGARGVFQARQEGSISCTPSGDQVVCQ